MRCKNLRTPAQTDFRIARICQYSAGLKIHHAGSVPCRSAKPDKYPCETPFQPFHVQNLMPAPHRERPRLVPTSAPPFFAFCPPPDILLDKSALIRTVSETGIFIPTVKPVGVSVKFNNCSALSVSFTASLQKISI